MNYLIAIIICTGLFAVGYFAVSFWRDISQAARASRERTNKLKKETKNK